MKTDIVQPLISNFVKSLRDIGYSFEVAVADILDNSITAKANTVKIVCVPQPEFIFALLDDGEGMSENELVSAMRLATKDPDTQRISSDLGKFGLGLKTASFSQCENLTVISKRSSEISVKQWDLQFISEKNEWLLITPELDSFNDFPLFNELMNQENGTLVFWRQIDSFLEADIPNKLHNLRNHLSLVFHCFIEGSVPGRKILKIYVNGNEVEAFNPFNPKHPATQELASEKIKYLNSEVRLKPYILPHHSKLSQQEYEKYATSNGYTRSQGFYLYRAYRLLIYGTWWGMHKTNDIHKLVRIRIDIANNQDSAWGIDIKKSTASPQTEIREDLKRVINQVTSKGSRPYTGRGKKIEDRNTIRFWELIANEGKVNFSINRNHPTIKELESKLNDREKKLLGVIFMGLESYLPIDAIIAQLNLNPLKVNQQSLVNKNELTDLIEELKTSGLSEEFINQLLKTELYKNQEVLLQDD